MGQGAMAESFTSPPTPLLKREGLLAKAGG